MYSYIKTHIVLLLLSIPFFGIAQSPVQVTAQMIPPYSVTLADYATANSDRLVVNLLLGDVTEFNRQVTLKLSVEGNGIAVQSADVVAGVSPITLDGGIPLRLTNIDLRPYFQIENLVGISPVQYSKPLPAGLYKFCFEAYDYLTGRLISKKSCAIAYIVLNDPPILNLPVRNENIVVKDPQNIIFNWTPRHINATNIQYEFTLAEIWDTNIDPQAGFLASRPLYQTITQSTTLLYGPAQTPLLPDKTYGWRVRAIAVDGINELSLFKNSGYSEVYHFNYTKQCSPPQYILAESNTYNAAQVFWQGVDHQKYQVQYRKKDGNNSGWFEVNAYNENAKIQRLEENTAYEYRVGGQCGENGGYTYSRLFEFTTTTRGESNFTCGVTPEQHIDNQEPLQTLVVNDMFTAGEFPITVKRVTTGNTEAPAVGEVAQGGNGRFSGWGYITVPYLADTKIKIGFADIKINTDYELIDGVLVTDYDPNWNGMDDVSDEIEVVTDAIDTVGDVAGDVIDTVGDVAGDVIDTIGDAIDNIGSGNDNPPVDPNIPPTDPDTPDPPTDENPPTDEETEDPPTTSDPPIDSDTDNPENDEGGEDYNKEIFIRYKGKDYKNGEVIEIPYSDDLIQQKFELSAAKENSKVEWSTHADQNTVAVTTSLGNGTTIKIDVKSYSETYLQAEHWESKEQFPDGDSKKVRVLLKILHKEFKLKELYASDNKNSRRVAKSGEILYLVKAKGITSNSDRNRKVNYKILTNPKLKKGREEDIIWNYSNINGTRQYDNGKINIYRNLWEREAMFTTSVEAGIPSKTSKSIDVLFVDGNVTTLDFMPPAVNSIVKGKLQDIEDNLKILDKINRKLGLSEKTKFKIDPIRVSGQKYNEEDEESRLYKIYEQGSVTAGVKAELAEVSFTHPALKLAERTGIFKAGAYFMFKIQAQVKGGVKRHKYVERNKYIGTDPFIKIVSKGCIEAGLRAELLVLKNQVEFDVKGYVEGCLAGELKYSYKKKKFQGAMYIPPVLLVAHAKIKSKGILKFELVDWRGKIEISDRIDLTYENED
jgi:hypothetical protein